MPSNITSGSIVDITVSRNQSAEAASASSFRALQKRILHTYGVHTPSPPVLRLRNATQTSLVLEWDPIQLATASLKSLSLYRDDAKAGSIPRPLEMLSTKISGLAIDTEYTFQLVLRTSAGTFSSEKIVCRTHKMTDLSGITVTPGIMPPDIKSSLTEAVQRIGAKMIDTVRIDTTHFVCTEGRGAAWEKAVETNIPVVRPEWVEGCEREGTIVSVRGYYLNADPKLRQIGPGVGAQQNRQNAPSHQSVSSSSLSKPQDINTNGRQGKNSSEREPQPHTPFPGAQFISASNGTEHDDTSAPSPPPKDTDDAKSQTPTADTPKAAGDDENNHEINGDGKVEEEKPEEPSSDVPQDSQPQPDKEKLENENQPPSGPRGKKKGKKGQKKGSQKPNGTGGEEGELSEVPL